VWITFGKFGGRKRFLDCGDAKTRPWQRCHDRVQRPVEEADPNGFLAVSAPAIVDFANRKIIVEPKIDG